MTARKTVIKTIAHHRSFGETGFVNSEALTTSSHASEPMAPIPLASMNKPRQANVSSAPAKTRRMMYEFFMARHFISRI